MKNKFWKKNTLFLVEDWSPIWERRQKFIYESINLKMNIPNSKILIFYSSVSAAGTFLEYNAFQWFLQKLARPKLFQFDIQNHFLD